MSLNRYNVLSLLYFTGIFLIILIGIYLRTKLYLSNYPMWYNEKALCINIHNNTLAEMFKPFYGLQKAPPLYCIFLSGFTKIFGYSRPVLRFIPYISGVAAFLPFYFFLKSMCKNKLAIMAGMYLFAVNVPLIYYCSEFKPYSSDVLLCLLFLLIYKYIKFENITNKQVILYTTASFLLTLSSFAMIFLIPAMVIAKYIEYRKIYFKTIWIFFGVFLTCIILYLPDIVTYKDMLNYWLTQEGFINLTYNSLIKNYRIFGEFLTFNNTTNLYNWVPLFVILGFIKLFRENKSTCYFYVMLFIFLYAASFLRIYPLSGRLLLYVIPIIILLMVKTIEYADNSRFIIRFIFISLMTFLILNVMNAFRTDIYDSKNILKLTGNLEERLYEQSVSHKLYKDSGANSTIYTVSWLSYLYDFSLIEFNETRIFELFQYDTCLKNWEQGMLNDIFNEKNKTREYWIVGEIDNEGKNMLYFYDKIEKKFKEQKTKYEKDKFGNFLLYRVNIK